MWPWCTSAEPHLTECTPPPPVPCPRLSLPGTGPSRTPLSTSCYTAHDSTPSRCCSDTNSTPWMCPSLTCPHCRRWQASTPQARKPSCASPKPSSGRQGNWHACEALTGLHHGSCVRIVITAQTTTTIFMSWHDLLSNVLLPLKINTIWCSYIFIIALPYGTLSCLISTPACLLCLFISTCPTFFYHNFSLLASKVDTKSTMQGTTDRVYVSFHSCSVGDVPKSTITDGICLCCLHITETDCFYLFIGYHLLSIKFARAW